MKGSNIVDEYRHVSDAAELQKEFVIVDRDHDGRVDFEEFKKLLDGLDSRMTLAELQIGFREVDTNNDGLIDCQEFIDWWTSD